MTIDEPLTPLTDYENWLPVREDKRPVGFTDPTDESNLMSYDEARRKGEGVAFQLSGTPFSVADWDDVLRDGTYRSEKAENLVEKAGTATEVSTSGSGLHQFFVGEIDDEYKQSGELDSGHVEFYSSNRYIVVTGLCRPSVGDRIEEREGWFKSIQRTICERRDSNETVEYDGDLDESVETVRHTIEQYAKSNSALSEKAGETLRLWDSTPDRSDNRSNGSNKDVAFASHLYFWCQADRDLAMDCIRSSNRWDAKFSERDAYLAGESWSVVDYAWDDASRNVFTGEYLEPPEKN